MRLRIGLVVGFVMGSSKKGVVLSSIGRWLLVVGWVVWWLYGLGNILGVGARVGGLVVWLPVGAFGG